jgi:very-short-patch-repair endonuclease
VLWNALKNKQLMGRKFRRQDSIEQYIVDFCCPAERLIIELDGKQHLDPVHRINDQVRDERLHSLGFTVLRFENDQVFNRIDDVLAAIAACFNR